MVHRQGVLIILVWFFKKIGGLMEKTDKLSVFISLVLRHKPEAANIQLDEHGWAEVDALIEGIRNTGRKSI